MFTSSFRSVISLSWELLTNEKNTLRIHSCTSVRYSLSCEVRRWILNLTQGKEALSKHITTHPDIAKPLMLPGKDLFLWRWTMLIWNWTCLYYFLQNCISFLRGINFFFMTTTMQSNFKCPEERTRKDEWKGIEWFIRVRRRFDKEFYNSRLLI